MKLVLTGVPNALTKKDVIRTITRALALRFGWGNFVLDTTEEEPDPGVEAKIEHTVDVLIVVK